MAVPIEGENAFRITTEGLVELARGLTSAKLVGTAPSKVRSTTQPTVRAFSQAMEEGVHHLPIVYHDAYVEPLKKKIERVVIETSKIGDGDPAETLFGAVSNHAPDSGLASPLRRFSVVVADLYRSFLEKEKRLGSRIPLAEVLPPLATFRPDCTKGPYTYESDVVHSIIGSEVGVVSLPITYRNHPLLWGLLAHETGGHDVLHADRWLLPELGAGIAAQWNNLAPSFGQSAGVAWLMGMLWKYWIDESAADIYGILNLGPAFALNLTAWLAALRAEAGLPLPTLMLSPAVAPDGTLDNHPPDILRIHLAIGAIGSLTALNPAIRQAYIGLLLELADLAAGGRETVSIEGNLPLHGQSKVPVQAEMPLPLMQYAAALVGSYIATAPLHALGGNTVQQIETWDDVDEMIAYRTAEGLRDKARDCQLGDPAHLLAGATLAGVADPNGYNSITAELEKGLDTAADCDPLWGRPVPRSSSASPLGVRFQIGKPEHAKHKVASA